MADHRVGVGAVRGPVVAGEIPSSRQARGKGPAMGVRSGENVVFVSGAFGAHPAVHRIAIFHHRRVLIDEIAAALIVAVQIRDATGYHHAIGVVPRPASDAVARIDGRLCPGAMGA